MRSKQPNDAKSYDPSVIVFSCIHVRFVCFKSLLDDLFFHIIFCLVSKTFSKTVLFIYMSGCINLIRLIPYTRTDIAFCCQMMRGIKTKPKFWFPFVLLKVIDLKYNKKLWQINSRNIFLQTQKRKRPYLLIIVEK